MAAVPKYPVTPAVLVLRGAGVAYAAHLYDYVERGGTRAGTAGLRRA